jgi:hypothetical protein
LGTEVELVKHGHGSRGGAALASTIAHATLAHPPLPQFYSAPIERQQPLSDRWVTAHRDVTSSFEIRLAGHGRGGRRPRTSMAAGRFPGAQQSTLKVDNGLE